MHHYHHFILSPEGRIEAQEDWALALQGRKKRKTILISSAFHLSHSFLPHSLFLWLCSASTLGGSQGFHTFHLDPAPTSSRSKKSPNPQQNPETFTLLLARHMFEKIWISIEQGWVQEPSFADLSSSSREAEGDPGDHQEAGSQVGLWLDWGSWLVIDIRNRAKALKKKEELPDESATRKADQEPVFPQVISNSFEVISKQTKFCRTHSM